MPELRFVGFSEEWEKETLGNLNKFSKGKGYSKNDLSDEGYQIFLYGQMYTDYQMQVNELKTHVKTLKKNSVLSNGNEVLIPSSGETALDLARASHMSISDVILGGDLNILIPCEKILPHFEALTLSTEKNRKNLSTLAQGKSVVHLYGTDIKTDVISYPDINEQEKIGDLFSKIDQLIESQQELVDQTIAFKKSMLQKMFPQKDSLAPEFRFEGFNDNWKSFKIKELANIKTGESNTQDADENGKYPFYIRSENPQTSNKYLYDEEAVLTIGDGKIGKVFFYVNGKYDLHQRVYRIFGFNENLDGKYFYHYFSKFFLRRAKSLSAKATVDSVRMEMISDMIIKVPNLEEQVKIRDFLEKLDEKIAREERLLDAYKDMKKSLLQKMFV